MEDMSIRTLSVVSLLVAATALTTACGVPETLAHMNERDRGAETAEKDIAAGDPHYYSGFGRMGQEAPGIDRRTGLPLWGLGCEIDEARGAFAAGYNEVVGAAFDAGRLTGMTLEHKWMERDQVVALFEAAHPVALAYDQETRITTADERFVIGLAPRFGNEGDTPYVFVTDSESGVRTELSFLGEERCRIAFAHGGTTAILRDDRYRTFMTFDLPRLVGMQTFIDPDREW